MIDSIPPAGSPTSAGAVRAMLDAMRTLEADATGGIGKTSGPQGAAPAPGFADAVSHAVRQVNGAQVQAQSLQGAYQRGEGVPLTDVVLGMHRASLAMEATMQVRNKVMKAYEDMLNMPL